MCDSVLLALFLPVFDSCLLLPRPVRRLWCSLWAMAGWTWCRHSWHKGRRSISRMMRAPRRWCVQASMATLTLLNYCWHSRSAMPPWLTVYVSHCLYFAASVSPVASSCEAEALLLCFRYYITKAESNHLLQKTHSVCQEKTKGIEMVCN